MDSNRLIELANQLVAIAAELRGDLALSPTIRLTEFIDSGNVFRVPGRSVPFSQFYGAFKGWLPFHERESCSKLLVRKELESLGFSLSAEGRSDQPRWMIDGLSTRPAASPREVGAPPSNPDYDSDAIFWRVRNLKSTHSWGEIAEIFNEEGLRTKLDNQFTAEAVNNIDGDLHNF